MCLYEFVAGGRKGAEGARRPTPKKRPDYFHHAHMQCTACLSPQRRGVREPDYPPFGWSGWSRSRATCCRDWPSHSLGQAWWPAPLPARQDKLTPDHDPCQTQQPRQPQRTARTSHGPTHSHRPNNHSRLQEPVHSSPNPHTDRPWTPTADLLQPAHDNQSLANHDTPLTAQPHTLQQTQRAAQAISGQPHDGDVPPLGFRV